MSEVLFIVPFTYDRFRDPPMGSLLLATILRNNGIHAEIFQLSQQEDFSDFHSFIDAMVEAIQAKNAKIVSFYTRCDIYHICLLIAEQIKLRTAATVVFGGPQADIVAKETLRTFSYVDYICQGEGETTVFPFFSSLLQGSADLSIDGLVYRKGTDIMQNPRPKFLANLDELPEIDFSIIGIEGDCSHAERFLIDVGRGCPFNCTYCSTNTFWGRKYRLKSPQRILSEILSLHNKYHVTSFSFAHDMFTLDRKQVIAICHMLKELDFPITWSCSARLDCIDNELIDIMADAGMIGIYLGIETGSERMQKVIRKNLKLHTAVDRIRHLHSKGIRVTTSFIHGFPEETPEDLSQTLSLIREFAKFDKVSIQNHLCAFLPGTELSLRYANDLVPASFFSDQTGFSGIEGCEDLIRSYPDVFPQYTEYHTELRERLEYFPLFVRVWNAVQPVYQHCSALYEKENLIDMYFDFIKVNESILSETIKLPYLDQLDHFLAHDQLPQRLASAELQETIRDCYRLAAVFHTSALQSVGQKTELLSFSPKEFQHGSDITTYTKKPTLVHFKSMPNSQVEMTIKSAF